MHFKYDFLKDAPPPPIFGRSGLIDSLSRVENALIVQKCLLTDYENNRLEFIFC